MRRINKGDIYYASLDGGVGSEENGARPVIVVQNDVGNEHSATVIIVPLTGRVEMEINQPTHYCLEPCGRMKYESIVLTEQIRVIDKKRLREYWGQLNSRQIEELHAYILIALGINKKIEK